MRKEYLTYVKDYVNRLEPAMDELVEKGIYKILILIFLFKLFYLLYF